MDIGSFLNVGNQASARINLTNNSDITAAILNLGVLVNGTGIVDLDNSNLTASGALSVGVAGNGQLMASNGSHLVTATTNIGGGSSEITIDASTWVNAGTLNNGVTGAGTGTLNIRNGSVVTAGITGFGTNMGATGNSTVEGSGTQFNVTSLGIGFVIASNGSLIVQNNALVNVLGATTLGPGTATLNLLTNGVLITSQLIGNTATLRANSSSGSFVTGFLPGQLALNGNGLTIDSNGFDIGILSNFSGAGGLTKTGNGALNIGSNQSYTGTTVVDQGTLAVNAVLSSAVQVLSGARLQGSGSVAGATIAGIIAPGNSIGTLNVIGNYIQQVGSLYEVEINPFGQSDLINITGTASINGGDVSVIKAPGIYTAGTRYTILTALGGIAGTYDSLIQTMPFLDLTLNYDTQNVYLDIARNFVSFASAATTLNQFNTALAIESLGVGNVVYDAVSSLTNLGLAPMAFNSLSGEIYASSLGALIEESRYIRYATLNRLQQSFSNKSEPFANESQFLLDNGITLWGQGFGSWGHLDGNTNAAKLNRSIGGFFLGADTLLTPQLRFGLATGLGSSDYKVNARQSFASNDNYYLAAYAGGKVSEFNLRTGAAYTWHNIDTHRTILFSGFSDAVQSNNTAETTQVFGELGYPVSFKRMVLEPFGGAAYVDADSWHFYETGEPSALNSSGQENTVYSTAGIRESADLLSSDKMRLAERVMLGWQHAFHHIDPQVLQVFNAGSSAFTIYGTPIARNSLIVDAGLFFHRPGYENVRFKLAYTGQWASHVEDNGVSGTIIYQLS